MENTTCNGCEFEKELASDEHCEKCIEEAQQLYEQTKMVNNNEISVE